MAQSGAQLRQSVTDQSTTEAGPAVLVTGCRWKSGRESGGKWKMVWDGVAMRPKGRGAATSDRPLPRDCSAAIAFCIIFLFKNY